MLQITIKPLSGILIQNIGEVNLGQTRLGVEKLIGSPNYSDSVSIDNLTINRAFYDAYELRIDYDKNDIVEFIEFIYGPFTQKTELRIFDTDPFKVDANKLIEILTSQNSGNINELEAPHSYAFENISVGIWRESIPDDILEWINEKKADGEYEMDKTWLDEEFEKSKHFWTIGIGRKNYYN